MNVNYEFSKIRGSFDNVKNDMKTITDKINVNYDEFVSSHSALTNQIGELSKNVIEVLAHFKTNHLNTEKKMAPTVELLELKSQIKELKKEIVKIQNQNHKINNTVSDLKKKDTDLKQIKKSLESSDLEIFLLKERVSEKDTEIIQLKNISKHMLQVMDELSKMEIDILNKTL